MVETIFLVGFLWGINQKLNEKPIIDRNQVIEQCIPDLEKMDKIIKHEFETERKIYWINVSYLRVCMKFIEPDNYHQGSQGSSEIYTYGKYKFYFQNNMLVRTSTTK